MNGNNVVQYIYDGWGKLINSYTGSVGAFVAQYNPFIYKSYYYDKETKLYYLNSRFYSPKLKQFLTIDDINYLDESLGNMNLFSYCNNNPIMMVDPSGHAVEWVLFAMLMLLTPIGGTVLQVVVSRICFYGFLIASIFDEDIRNDMSAIGWNPFNKDESLVLNSNSVSFYKGVPVFRTNLDRSGSFGAIFLKRGDYDKQGNFYKLTDVNELKHERGHNWQLMMMGIGTYGITVGIPSPAELGQWSKQGLYYYAPWEAMADYLGGVTSRYGGAIPQQQINNALVYYILSLINPRYVVYYWF